MSANGRGCGADDGSGRVEVVELLLGLGTSADVEDGNGERALHTAAWADSVPVARLLIERGAEIDPRDRRFNATPLGWAIHLGKPQLVDYLSTVSSDILSLCAAGKVERLRSLLRAQPALAKTVHNDRTALFALPEESEDLAIEIAELLLSHGADASIKNSNG